MVYIKRISIVGFKSYKDLTSIEPFSPKHNAVVGRNGSGKSNFFAAIRFVLSDQYSHMRPDERTALLHEGAGSHVMSAQVEIVFDNSDGRFPIDRDEVVIRRSIGLKKDEFFLDNKYVPKTEIINLLESAGFSRSNPYYIVQQGKIKELTVMKDAQRLELLKEVAGTRVYDDRRTQSVKIMEEADGRVKKVTELLAYIEERLAELEGEKNELKEYQQLDKTRRALEYAVYDQELKDTQAKLARIEEDRRQESEKSSQVHHQAEEARAKLKSLEHDLKSAKAELSLLVSERDAAQQDRQEFIRSRAKLELALRDSEDSLDTTRDRQRKLAQEREKLLKTIRAREAELEDVRPQGQEQARVVAELQQQLAAKERRVQELYAKQGRQKQFSNKAERDRWIAEEQQDIQSTLTSQRKQLQTLEAETKKMNNELTKMQRDIDEKTSGIEERVKLIGESETEISERRIEIDRAQNERKDMWRKDAELDQRLLQLKTDLGKLERTLTQTTPKETNRGLTALKQVVAEHNIPGVYGPLIELFTVDEKYFTATEVAAGMSLFHVVVDTDETAARVIDLLNRESLGRVSLLPLNKLVAKEVKFDGLSRDDAIPLLDKLKFQPMYRKAFLQVFNKTLVARSLEVAGELSQKYDCNCITLDGDQVSRRGAITGGYIDKQKSRLDLMHHIKDIRKNFDELDEESKKTKVAIEESAKVVTRGLSELSKIETRVQQLRTTHEQLSLELRALKTDQTARQQSVEEKERAAEAIRTLIRTAEAQLAALERERGTELTSQLTAGEQKELATLNKEIDQMKQQLIDATHLRTETEGRVHELEHSLSENLIKRREEIESELQQLSVERSEEDRQRKARELESVRKEVEHIQSRIKGLQHDVEQKTKQIRDLEGQLDELRTTLGKMQASAQEESKGMDKLLQQRSNLAIRKEECLKKIRDLGTLPADAQKYAGTSVKELLKQLHTVNEKLKKYSHVNKKAYDQFVNFSEQRSTLLVRLEEAQTSAKKIDELIKTLDQRKDEAIVRTFKQVAKHFEEVFAELVPGGTASLVMQHEDEPVDTDSEPTPRSAVRNYTGIGIKVAFGGSATQYMHQLSGGQKATTALALIFAIQRCDPAPFYLFDEIDSALDQNARAAVARLIEKQSDSAQFITTTFKPELVQHADKCYQVTFTNKVSQIDVVDTEHGLELIHEEEQEERRRGGIVEE